jgi:hypothetical protein
VSTLKLKKNFIFILPCEWNFYRREKSIKINFLFILRNFIFGKQNPSEIEALSIKKGHSFDEALLYQKLHTKCIQFI